MTDDQTPAPEAGDEVVQSEAEQAAASEATESTEGQVDDQPAEENGEGQEPKPDAEEKSKSQQRRERRKAELERLRTEKAEFEEKYNRSQERLKRYQEAAQSSQPPKEGDFQSYDEYQAALAAFHSMKALDGRQRQETESEASEYQRQIEEREQARKTELAQSWADQMAEARQRYTDFDQVVGDQSLPITDVGAEIIASSDHGADVAYYLGSNRAEAAAIAKMNPLDQARALGSIEARLSTPKPNKTSSTPEPINPVKGKGSASKDVSKMSFAEYKAAREAGKI